MTAWKARVRDAFDRADDYDAAAVIQAQAAERLAERVAALQLPPRPRILEIGCGTGLLGAALRQRLPGADWTFTDIAPAMLSRCQARLGTGPDVRYLVLDGEHADTMSDGRFDLIVSNLAAQWFQDLGGAIGRLAALLRAGGYLAFTTLIDGTFAEWKRAHIDIGLAAATPDYPTLGALRALLPSADIGGFTLQEHHGDGRAFLRSLKAIGAGTAIARPPLPPGDLRRVLRRFEADGALARYEIACCILRRADD